MSLLCHCTSCERFLQPAPGPFCQACGSRLVFFYVPSPGPLTSTEKWDDYPLTGFDAGAPYFDPPWSAGLQSTEVSTCSLKRMLCLVVLCPTQLRHDCQIAVAAVDHCTDLGLRRA